VTWAGPGGGAGFDVVVVGGAAAVVDVVVVVAVRRAASPVCAGEMRIVAIPVAGVACGEVAAGTTVICVSATTTAATRRK
jgi:hypothetical protein